MHKMKKKTLVVFYSRTGNTKKLAQRLAKKLMADIDEIISPKKYDGFWGYLRGGRDVIFKRIPKIKFTYDPFNYEKVIIGSPIWVGTYAPPIRAYLHLNSRRFDKIAFFCSRGGGEIKKGLREFEEMAQKPIAVLSVVEREINSKTINKALINFLKKIK